MANRKELVFATTNTDCLVPTSHKLNQDGYFRKRVWFKGALKLMMYHRYIWIKENGDIPDGYEIDHVCRNRACCNPKHLQLLSNKEHKVKTNKERYRKRFLQAKQFWKETGADSKEIATKFQVHNASAVRWLKLWNSNVQRLSR